MFLGLHIDQFHSELGFNCEAFKFSGFWLPITDGSASGSVVMDLAD
jgi:hypothetical protein